MFILGRKEYTKLKTIHTCVNIESKNRQEIEINKRITKYNKTVEMLYPLLKDKFVPRECKVTIYNTILKPILL